MPARRPIRRCAIWSIAGGRRNPATFAEAEIAVLAPPGIALGRQIALDLRPPAFNRMREVCQWIREEVELEDRILYEGMPIRLGEKESHDKVCGGT